MKDSIWARQKGLFTPEEEARLRAASVLVAGLGGLGSFVAEGLARLGVGGLVLVDPDRVNPSDLNRQILYTAEDIGAFKVEVAKERLLRVRDDLRVEAWVKRITSESSLPPKVDVVVDALDNWEGRFALDALAKEAGLPLVHAGLSGTFGQVTSILPGSPVRLKEIFSGAKEEESPQVSYPICAVLGAIQVEECAKIICGREETLAGRLLLVDLSDYTFELIPLVR